MAAPTNNARRLSARRVQPGHVRTWEGSERSFLSWCELLLPEGFDVVAQPRDLADLYRRDPRPAGLIPEVKIRCQRTDRYVFAEVKRQGEKGNAEERVYKLFTPTFITRVAARTGLDYHPFVAVFCDDLATHPRYRVRFAAHLEQGSYLCWKGSDPALLAGFLDDLRHRWLEPPELGPSPVRSCAAVLSALPQRSAPPGPERLGAAQLSLL